MMMDLTSDIDTGYDELQRRLHDKELIDAKYKIAQE
jgi:hypothetical protein